MAYEMFLSEDFGDHEQTDNIYEAIVAISLRARQIGEEHRKEMDAYLSQVEMMERFQDDEDNFDEPLKHHDPVIQFEKPTVLALREMIADKLHVTNPDREAIEAEKAAKEEMLSNTVSLGEDALSFGGKLDLSGESDEPIPSKLSLDE